MKTLYKKPSTMFIAAMLMAVGFSGCENATTTTPQATNIETTNTNAVTHTTNEVISNSNKDNLDGTTDSDGEKTDTTIKSEVDEINTSDWKTYENKDIGLSFLYPKEWNITENEDQQIYSHIIDNNDIYEHQLINMYVQWSDRHEDIIYDSGVTNYSLDKWLTCDYIYDLQSDCNIVKGDDFTVVQRNGKVESPFGDKYMVLAYQYDNYTVVIDARSLLREVQAGQAGNNNLDGIDYINSIISTIKID